MKMVGNFGMLSRWEPSLTSNCNPHERSDIPDVPYHAKRCAHAGYTSKHHAARVSKWLARTSRAARPAARFHAFTMARRKPPGGMAWRAELRSSWNVICTLETS